MLGEPYERPVDFDLGAWWARASRDYELAAYRGTAVMRLSPLGRSLVDLLGPYVVKAVERTASKPDKSG